MQKNLEVLLIFPPNVETVEPFKSAKAKPPRLMWGFPLGLGYLAAVLREAGFKVSILDACFDFLSIEDIISKVRDLNPGLVGIGSLTHILRSSLELARKIKETDKNIKIVFGGPHATYDYENLLKFDFIDYVVLGEGEHTFLELCEKLRNNESVEGIKGLAFKTQEGIKKAGFRPLIEDLDHLPLPARDLLDFNKYIKSYGVLKKSVDVISSRGCTNMCAFCSSAHLFGRWRTRTPENVISEIKLLLNNYPGIKSINFMDDNFTADKKRVLRLSSLMVADDLNTYNWVCLARVDQIDEEIAFAIKAAGCVRVHLGIESGSEQILKNINKRISLEQAKNAVDLLKKAKIEAHSFFMVGHPGETPDTIGLTRRFARNLKSSNTGIFITQIFPGTRLELLQPVRDWAGYLYEPEVKAPSIFTHPCVPCFIPEGLDREKLKKICADMTREFILFHFFRRFHLFIKKFVTEPRATAQYIADVFLKK
jgi:radical SAM superfamily enzyme YgiQ (UPF0313 family)